MGSEVFIAGAGPTGLVLALWLTRQGVPVRIVDKAAGPGTTSRAMAVQPRTLELYRQLGIAEPVVAEGHPNPGLNVWVKGKRRAHLSFLEAGRDLTPFPFILIYPQDRHERLLVAKLREFGIEVEWNTELLGFEDRGDCVVVRMRGAANREETGEARYLAGSDGASSTIRQQLGTGFPGGTYSKIFYVADVRIAGPAANGEVNVALDDSDFVAVLNYDKAGSARLIGIVPDEGECAQSQLTFDDVSHRAIDRLGLEVKAVNWFSTYRVHHRVTDRFRMGRAFLLGDAAHIHSPAGGQGMNTGIGDAINLAWKVAAVLKNEAPEALLDSYEFERRAFAERLVKTTDAMFTFVTAGGNFANFVRTEIAPIFIPAAYHIEAIREYLFRIVSQTMLNYHGSPVSQGSAGDVKGGDRLPWVRTKTADNYDSLSTIGWQAHVYGAVAFSVSDWCGSNGIPLHTFEWDDAYERAGFAQDALYLLRPDTYVGFACSDPSVRALDSYLTERGLRHRETSVR